MQSRCIKRKQKGKDVYTQFLDAATPAQSGSSGLSAEQTPLTNPD